MSHKRLQQIFAIVSCASFFGTTVYGAVGTFNGASEQPKAPISTTSQASQWQAQVKGYEQVLQREPENQVALDGLVNARLQLQDERGAIAPLEKLVKLHSQRQDYKALLAQVKQQAHKGDRHS